MADQYVDLNTLRFNMYNVHEVASYFQKGPFADVDKEMVDIYLDAMKDFCDKECYPVFREMDEDPARYEDGKIVIHPSFEKILKQGAEMGMIGSVMPFDHGGMQMPYVSHTASTFILDAANNNVGGYFGLTLGSAELINAFGNETLKETYVPNMIAGKWGGTMCLTEPQAGSSLSDVVTAASPQEDGSYKIKGQKIFISGGDNEFQENFVHLVLARIDGAPAGTKGISLFVVPKKRIVGDGLENNDVITAGDFQKMGQRGYCTTHLVFGENDDCQGWLVGEPHYGLRYMFQMMNTARIDVGRGAAAIATAAYHASLQYAKERPQGRRISSSGGKNVNEGQTLIINHPDVRRMLLFQKAVAEGGLSLVMQASVYHDMQRVTTDENEKNKYNLLLELLTPIVKTYPSEMGKHATSTGVQVLGGYGFCSEFVLQQYYRDIRIFSLYEGTTGIQSLDLLGRKLTMNNGKAMFLLADEMMETIQAAMNHNDLKPYGEALAEKLQLNKKVLEFLIGFAQKGEHERFISDATIFMEFFGTLVVGWQWLKIAVKAKQALLTNDTTYSNDFYESKIHTMRFYYKYEMAKMTGCAQVLMDENVLTIKNEKSVFA